MKKIIYSNYTKFIAAVLFVVSIVSGALIVTDGISKYCNEDEYIYGFENSFSETRSFMHMLEAPEMAVFNAYHDFYYRNDETEKITVENGMLIKVDGRTLSKNIEKWLNDIYCLDKINYFVEWNGKIYTNCGAKSAKDLMESQFYRYTVLNGQGNMVSEGTQPISYSYAFEEILQFDKTSKITICTNIKQDYIEESEEIWERQATVVYDTFTETLFFVVLSLLLLIYLICVCGTNKDGEQKTIWLDNIWTEVHLAVVAGFSLGAVVVFAVLLDEIFIGQFPSDLIDIVVGAVSALTGSVVLTSLLSIIRNIKCRNFVQTSIIARIVKWWWQITVKLSKWFWRKIKSFKKIILYTLSKKTGVILISMLFAYTALIGLFGIFTLEAGNPFWIFVGIVLFVGASFLVAHRAKDLDEVKKGVSEVRNGNVAYKIPELKSEDMKALATNINDIAKGLDESVSAKVKAERLKTELITNVSHDLKTPITSIISYTELLSKIEELPEEAKDYVSVISKKSERLKNLTQDLFDISKVQSGNEDVILEKLDVALLISQSLGEHDSEIQKSELPFCVNTPKELYISADGRKMSRVVSNLINNILKYSMKNTRVFITVFENDGEVVMEFKNIASYPMNFSADEIVGRFVRGDESRTADGNGLGLAIAKSYTEICGGKFEVIIDGDMFKVNLKFKN